MNGTAKRLVVGISGASGALLAVDLLEVLRALNHWETHVIATPSALTTLAHELPERKDAYRELADRYYDNDDIGATIASGSFPVAGMVVVPCSMKTVAGIHSGYSENLLLRAADVTVKERRLLILVARETPLSPIHLRNMSDLAALGIIIMPSMMTFYGMPDSIGRMVRQITGKILSVFGEEAEGYCRWDGIE